LSEQPGGPGRQSCRPARAAQAVPDRRREPRRRHQRLSQAGDLGRVPRQFRSRLLGRAGRATMSNLAYDARADAEEIAQQDIAAMQALRPIPRISIQAFCETEGVSGPIERAGEDRRMAKAHLKVHMGGIPTAIEFYQSAPTPNLILLESRAEPKE